MHHTSKRDGSVICCSMSGVSVTWCQCRCGCGAEVQSLEKLAQNDWRQPQPEQNKDMTGDEKSENGHICMFTSFLFHSFVFMHTQKHVSHSEVG